MEEQFKKVWKKEDETALRKKHVPIVKVEERNGEVKVDVKVGSIEHPSEAAHFIQSIEVFDGEISLTRINLTHFSKPKVCFISEMSAFLSILKTSSLVFSILKEKPERLKIRAFCNLHGTWQYE